MIKRPLMWMTIAYIFGILLAKQKEFYVCGILLCLLYIIILLLLVWKVSNQYVNKKDGFLFLIPVMVFLGIMITKNQLSTNSMDLAFDDKVNGNVVGTVYMIIDKGDKKAIYLKDNIIRLNKKVLAKVKTTKANSSGIDSSLISYNIEKFDYIHSNESKSNVVNLDVKNSKEIKLTATNLKTIKQKAKNYKAINQEVTNLEVTNLKATNLKATNLKVTNLKATNLKATNLKATNLEVTNLKEINSNTFKSNKIHSVRLNSNINQLNGNNINGDNNTDGNNNVNGNNNINNNIMRNNNISRENNMNNNASINTFENYYEYLSKRLIIYTTDTILVQVGNTLSVDGQIIKFQKATNLGQYDEYNYNKIKQIDYKVYASKLQIIDYSYSKLAKVLQDIKDKLSLTYQRLLNEKEAGIILAMLLGEKSLLDANINNLYQVNGISHILSISGLHISLIGLFIYKLLNKTGLNQVLSIAIAIIFIYCYGLLTNFGVATNRAVVMFIVALLAKIFGKTYDLLTSTSLSAFIILIQSPLQIYDGGFLLSFGAMIAFAILIPIFQGLFLSDKEYSDEKESKERKLEWDESKEGESEWNESKDGESKEESEESNSLVIKSSIIHNNLLVKILTKSKFIFDSIITSLSVNLVSIPILLYFFYQFPPYSVIINIIIIPIMSLLLLLAMIGGIFGCFSFVIGRFLMGGVHYILVFSELICNIFSKLPFHLITVGKPAMIKIILYYVILLIFIFAANHFKNRKSVLILLFLSTIFIRYHKNLEVTFLDVGQGDSIFLRTPTNVTFLIDGGSTSVSNVGKYRIEPFLKASGVGVLDYAIMTHADEDHISGLIESIEMSDDTGVKVKNLILPNTSLRDTAYESLITTATNHGVHIIYIEKGDIIQEKNLVITCLHPTYDFATDSRNDVSTVLSLSYKEFDLLLTGDIGEIPEKMLVDILNNTKREKENHLFGDYNIAIDYDVLKVAHHGSRNSTLEDFLEIVKPEISVISCGKDNKYGHPHAETLKRLKEEESEVLQTTECGAITIQTDGRNMKILKFTDEK